MELTKKNVGQVKTRSESVKDPGSRRILFEDDDEGYSVAAVGSKQTRIRLLITDARRSRLRVGMMDTWAADDEHLLDKRSTIAWIPTRKYQGPSGSPWESTWQVKRQRFREAS